MSQYSSPGFGQYPSQPYVEQRTSILAVLSLVFALICCLPGPGVLGALFGITGLIAISRSNDRLVGRGLAIAGIIISLVVTAVWLGLSIGAGRAWSEYEKELAVPIATKLKAMDQGDFAPIRASLTPEANARITDADFEKMRQSYQAELGKIVGAPPNFIETARGFMASGQALEQMQGRNDVIPAVLNFDKGPGIVMLQIDPASGRGSKGPGLKYVNLIIASPNGKKWALWDPVRLPPGGTPSTTGTTPPPDAPAPPPSGTTPPENPATPESPAPKTPETPKGPG